MSDRLYNQQINSYYLQPKNVGTLNNNDADVGTSIVGTPAVGIVLKLQIKVHDNTIEQATNKVYGCGAAIATGSYVTDKLKGMSLDQALSMDSTSISQALSLPPVKMYCAIMACDAVKAAVNDYYKKNNCV